MPRQLQAGRSSLPQRRFESDADLVAATATAGGPFFFAARKIGNGHGTPLRLRILQAKPCIDSQVYTLKSRITARWMAFQGKSLHRFTSLGLKSRIDAALALRRRSAGGPFFFAAAKIRIGRGSRCCTPAAGGPFFFAAAKIRIGCGTRCCHGHCRRAILLCCSEDLNRMQNSLLPRSL